MNMIDVMKRLQEITDRSPEIAQALDNVSRMNAPVKEGIEIKTSGDDAILAQILKLAGVVGGVNTPDMAAGPGDMPGGPLSSPDPMAGAMSSDPFASSDPLGSLDSVMGMGDMPNLPVPMDGPVDSHMDKPDELGDITKLAGISKPAMGGGLPGEPEDAHMEPMDEPMDMDIEVGAGADDGDIAAAEASGNRPYPNSPHEVVKGPEASYPNGNDLNRKKITAPKVAGGDNPMHVAVTFD